MLKIIRKRLIVRPGYCSAERERKTSFHERERERERGIGEDSVCHGVLTQVSDEPQNLPFWESAQSMKIKAKFT